MKESGERFEKWALAQGDSIARHCKNHSGKPCHKYLSTFTHWEWEAWQAAFEAGRGQEAELLDHALFCMDRGCKRCSEAIEQRRPAPPDSGDAL